MKKFVVGFFVFCWLSLVLGYVTYVTGFHMVPLTNKAEINLQNQEMQKLLSSANLTPNSVLLVHFLNSECGCSGSIIKYLAQRKKSLKFDELIVLANDQTKKYKTILENNGFKVLLFNEEDLLTKFSIEALPLLTIFNNQEKVYSGGYNEQQMHKKNYQDIQIAEQILNSNKNLADQKLPDFKIFGCSNGKVNKLASDPMGFKYGISF